MPYPLEKKSNTKNREIKYSRNVNFFQSRNEIPLNITRILGKEFQNSPIFLFYSNFNLSSFKLINIH